MLASLPRCVAPARYRCPIALADRAALLARICSSSAWIMRVSTPRATRSPGCLARDLTAAVLVSPITACFDAT